MRMRHENHFPGRGLGGKGGRSEGSGFKEPRGPRGKWSLETQGAVGNRLGVWEVRVVLEEKRSASTEMLVGWLNASTPCFCSPDGRVFLHKSVSIWEVEWQRVSDGVGAWGGQRAAAWPSRRPAPSWPQLSLALVSCEAPPDRLPPWRAELWLSA